MSLAIHELNLGRKIRHLREAAGKTLAEAAREMGLPAELIARIEENEVTPPVATLLHIAKLFHVELGLFFETERKDEEFAVVRKGNEKKFRRVFPQGKNPLSYRYWALAPLMRNKKMEPFLVAFSPSKETVPTVAHDGQEFLHVLSGSVEFRIGAKKGTLKAGDSLYFESKSPHAFRALGRKGAKAVVVLYPH